MPTSSQLPLHVYYKKYKRNGDGTGEEQPTGNHKLVKAKIVVKTNKNCCTLPKPTVSEGSKSTRKQELRQCIRTSTEHPIVETSSSRLKPEVDTASCVPNLHENKPIEGTSKNNVDEFLADSGTAVNLDKFFKIKSYSPEMHPPKDKDIRLRVTNSRKLGELKNSQENNKEMTTFSTVNLLQQSETLGGIRVTSGMPRRKQATHSPKHLSLELGSCQGQIFSSPRSALQSNLQATRSFLIKQVELQENKQKVIESGTNGNSAYWDYGNDDEDAISLVYRENHPTAWDGVDNKDDPAENDDDPEINDEVEYVFQKPVIHITHKVKKTEKKSVQFEEPYAEDLSLKSLSDTDSDTQPKPQPQKQPQAQKQPEKQPQLQQQPQKQLQPQKQPQPQLQLQKQPQPQKQPQLQLQLQRQPQQQPPLPNQIEKSPRHTLKLRTMLFSDLRTSKGLRSSGTENFMVTGVSPSRTEYKFEETFPLKTYLSPGSTVQQGTVQTVSDKLTSPLHTRKASVSRSAQNRTYSTVVPSKEKEDLTVRASTLVPSVNYKKHFEFQLNENEEKIKENEAHTDSSDGCHLLPAKMYRVVKHQRNKRTLSCDTPPSTPQISGPMDTLKFVNQSKNEQASHANRPSRSVIKSSVKSQVDSEGESKLKQAQINTRMHNTEDVNQVPQKKKANSKKLVGLKTTEPDNSSKLGFNTNQVTEKSEQEIKEVPPGKTPAKNSNKMVENGSDRMKEIYMDKLKKSLEPVRIFSSKPIEDPLKVCFDFTGTDLTHKQVKMAATQTLSESQGCHVTEVEFIPRNVILGTNWCDNRWVLGVNNKLAHRMISGKGIRIQGSYVRVRSYQDVMNEEYQRFVQKTQENGGPSFIDDLLAT